MIWAVEANISQFVHGDEDSSSSSCSARIPSSEYPAHHWMFRLLRSSWLGLDVISRGNSCVRRLLGLKKRNLGGFFAEK